MVIGISGKIGSGKDEIGKIIQYLTWKKASIESIKDLTEENIRKFDTFKSDFLDKGITYPYLSDWKIKKFADSLKDIVCILIGCTREQLEDREFKNKELGEEWNCFVENSTFDKRFKLLHIDEPLTMGRCIYREMTPRLLLQLLGTEAGRDIIHPNIWVNALFSKYTGKLENSIAYTWEEQDTEYLDYIYPNWIITDMRFPNELKAVKDRGGITIRVNRYPKTVWRSRGPNNNKEISFDPSNQQHLDLWKGGCLTQHASENSLDNAKFDYTVDNNGTIDELVIKVKEILIKEEII